MSETTQDAVAQIERCMSALYLELPEMVAKDAHKMIRENVRILLAQLDAAQADTRLLDWMDEQRMQAHISTMHPTWMLFKDDDLGARSEGATSLREAIDKALSAGVSPEATEGSE